MPGSLVNRTGLEALIGEVDHNKVLVNIAAHKHLALNEVNGNPLNVGNETKGPLEGTRTSVVVQAGNLQPQCPGRRRLGHRLTFDQGVCRSYWGRTGSPAIRPGAAQRAG